MTPVKFYLSLTAMVLSGFLLLGQTRAQETVPPQETTPQETSTQETSTQETSTQETTPPATSETASDAGVTEQLEQKVRELGDTLDQSETVQEVSAGILKPIYDVAEWIAFPAFYWVAFCLMTAGVVSFLGQLVFAKLLLLLRGSLNLPEILGDLLGLLISAVGLILTTQAATENSSFTSSPAAVVSSAAAGLVIGFIFYWWGQRQELNAARGARESAKPPRRARM